ncbi:MAG: hypothetical protein D6775_16560 [Caldilineae bacterium]|nr:MAG: hypothetical protein D6775_16560 [Caldilineae bacterium]
MDSAMISKIMKAKQYAAQRDRMEFQAFTVVFSGNHRDHTVTFDRGKWTCTCDFFAQRQICSHTMAMEKVLEGMIPVPAGSNGSASS